MLLEKKSALTSYFTLTQKIPNMLQVYQGQSVIPKRKSQKSSIYASTAPVAIVNSIIFTKCNSESIQFNCIRV